MNIRPSSRYRVSDRTLLEADQPVRQIVVLVSRARRLAGCLIDLVVVTLIAAAFVFSIVEVFGYGSLDWIDSEAKDWAATTFSYLLYCFAMEVTIGRTLGKIMTGLTMVNEQGGSPALGQTLVRTLVRLVPFDPVSIFRASRRCWHDTLSGTCVIRSD